MEPSGHRWSESGRQSSQSHRVRSREDHSSSGHRRGSDQKYPPSSAPNPGDDRHGWMHPDARHRAYFTSPPPRPADYPATSYITHGHDYHRSHSMSTPQPRHAGYDYPPHSYWDYKGNYGYYDQDYYTAQYGHKDAGQWAAQDWWRSDPGHHERSYEQEQPGRAYTEQEQPGRAYTEQYIYDQQRDSSKAQCYESEDRSSKDKEEASSCYPGNLASSKNSGMSSSSCELSQYINGADPVHHSSDTVRQMAVPFKYTVPHAVVSFGPAGQLIRVSPGISIQETPGQLEIHSLEVILGETQEQLEMRTFPGPLAREDLHKIDAIEFAHQRAEACLRDDKHPDRNAAALLWNLLILLCRQNGRIVGSDIAELLVQNSQADETRVQNARTLIDFSENQLAPEPEPYKEEDLLTGHLSSFSSESSQKDLDSYTKLLLAGRKKEALDSAMNSGLWGHALFLASKMDNRSYTTVLNRFTSQLTASDPLQTLFQMLSGRVPTVATCCGNEKWGDWKPHLAILLSNESGELAVQQKAIITMGDTLASRGLLHAAHVCYLTARTLFGVFTHKAARLVLLGSSHRLPFFEFASNVSIQCTELFEYCQTLGGSVFSIPSFQVYKFLYASRLLDYGLVSQAFHYCEVVGKAILQQQEEPFLVLSGEVIKLAERLRQCEGQQLSGDAQDPNWLQQLRLRHHDVQMGRYACNDTYQSPAEGSALVHGESKVCSDSDIDGLRSDVKSPKAELLYYRGTEEEDKPWAQAAGQPEDRPWVQAAGQQEDNPWAQAAGQQEDKPWAQAAAQQEDNPWAQAAGQQEDMTAWGSRGTENWRPQASLTMPVDSAPPTLVMAGSQGSSYHNTDNAEVKPAALRSSLEWLPPSTTESGQFCSGMTMLNTMAETDHSQGVHSQQPITQEMSMLGMGSQPANTLHKQSTKTGWFSGWFKSKDVQNENSDNPAQTESVPAAGHWPPPPSMGSHSSPAGVNPFSKYAGQKPV